LTGSPRFREVSVLERRGLCRIKKAAAADSEFLPRAYGS
jgi:hypothetical protein